MSPLIEAGFQVEIARDGVSGLREFERIKPALVLVEAMLPKKHGFEVCQEIKRTDHGQHTPVLITAAAFRGQRFRSDAIGTYGGDEYLEKPIAAEDLVSVCKRFLAGEGRAVVENVPRTVTAAGAPERPVERKIPALDEMTDDELDACLDSALLDPTEATATSARPAESPAAPVQATAETRAKPDTVSDALQELSDQLDTIMMDELIEAVDGLSSIATDDAEAVESRRTESPAEEPRVVQAPAPPPAKVGRPSAPAKGKPPGAPAKAKTPSAPAKAEPSSSPAKAETPHARAKVEPRSAPAKNACSNPATAPKASKPAPPPEEVRDPATAPTKVDPGKQPSAEPPAETAPAPVRAKTGATGKGAQLRPTAGVEQVGGIAVRISSEEPTASVATPADRLEAPVSQGKRRSRAWIPWTIGVSAVLVAVGVGAVFVFNERPEVAKARQPRPAVPQDATTGWTASQTRNGDADASPVETEDFSSSTAIGETGDLESVRSVAAIPSPSRIQETTRPATKPEPTRSTPPPARAETPTRTAQRTPTAPATARPTAGQPKPGSTSGAPAERIVTRAPDSTGTRSVTPAAKAPEGADTESVVPVGKPQSTETTRPEELTETEPRQTESSPVTLPKPAVAGSSGDRSGSPVIQSETNDDAPASPRTVPQGDSPVAPEQSWPMLDDAQIETESLPAPAPPEPRTERGALVGLGQVDSPPVSLTRQQPVYDPVARRLNQQGTVELRLLVDDTGRVAGVEMLSSIPRSRLNDAASRAVRKWTYRPAYKDGVPVKVWITERIVFKL